MAGNKTQINALLYPALPLKIQIVMKSWFEKSSIISYSYAMQNFHYLVGFIGYFF